MNSETCNIQRKLISTVAVKCSVQHATYWSTWVSYICHYQGSSEQVVIDLYSGLCTY